MIGTLFYFFAVCWGAAYVVSWSKIGGPIRALTAPVPFLGQLVQCPACLGFWIGVAYSILGYGPAAGGNVVEIIAAGLAACGVNRIIAGGAHDGEEHDYEAPDRG